MTTISKIPIRTVFDSNNSPLGLSEFQTGEVVSIEHGGTGANTTANARFNLSVDNVNVRALISVVGAGTYDNTTGVITIQTGAVTSVGGQTGAVSNAQLACSIISSGVLTSANIGELTNLYFTNTRAVGALTGGTGVNIDANGLITSFVVGGVSSVGGSTGDISNAQLASSITSSGLLTTSNVSEGTNQYFTNARVQTYLQAVGNIYPSGNNIQDLGRPTNRFKDLYLSGNSIYLGSVVLSSSDDGKFSVNSSGTTLNVATSSDLTTANVTEVNNLYFTNARVYANVESIGYASNSYVNSRLLSKANVADLTTANVSEVSNLYFTNARVYANVSALNYATTAYVAGEIANLVNSAPSTLDTLNELATALNNDPSFATTTATLIGNSYNQANAAFAAANTKVATVAGVTSTTISNSVIASGISQTGILTTANVTEVNNLYFTNARVYANVESIGYASNSYVNSRLLSKANVADLNTSNISEGSNLYFSNARAREAISVTGAATYDNTTGVINVTGGVTSVGGATGAVSNAQLAAAITSSGLLTTSNVIEGANLYYTVQRANTAIDNRVTKTFIDNLNVDADTLDGQDGTYFLDWTNTTNKPDPVVNVTITGDITGSAEATLDNLTSNTISISATIAPNSVALGTDTTGPYVGNLVAGTGVTITGLGNENTTPTISIGQAVATNSDVQFAKVNASGQVRITDTTESIGSGSGALVVSGGASFSGNVNISGNLNVAGNIVTFSANDIVLTDPLIFLADGNSADVVDIGFIGHYTNPYLAHTGLARDASDGIYKLFANVVANPTTTVDFTNATYSTLKLGNLLSDVATFSGNVSTGNVSANRGTFTSTALGTVTSGAIVVNNTTTTLKIADQFVQSYTGIGPVIVFDSFPTLNGFNIRNSELSVDGGTGTYWAGQSGVAQATDHKAGVYATSPTANNSFFSFGTNGSNYMSVGVEGSLFVGTAKPSNDGGLNSSYAGWLVVQSGGKFGGDVNTLGALKFDDATNGYIQFHDGTVQNTAFRTSVLTTANVSEVNNLYFTNARVYANVESIGYASNSYVNTRLTTKANVADLTTSNVTEGSNLYFSNARAREAISVTGAATYDNTTGVINVTGGVTSVGGATGAVSNAQLLSALQNTGYLTTANITEVNNLYFTNARVYANVESIGYASNSYVNTRLTTKANVADLTTANVSEVSNLYFTNARVYANVVALNYATTSYVAGEIANLVNSAPSTLDTLNELASALNNDPSFASTTATLIGNSYNQANAAFAAANTKVATVAGVTSTTISNSALADGITSSGLLTTANVIEVSNLYFTNARVYANVESIGYASNSYVNTRLTTKANVADLTTSNVSEVGNLYFTNTRAISALTEGSGINIDANGLITASVTAGAVDSFNVISVVNGTEGNIIASGSDTLKIETTGLITANTNPSTKTLSFTIGGNFPFFDSTGSQNNIALRVADSTVQSSVSFIYLPFSKSDGTSVNTLRYQ